MLKLKISKNRINAILKQLAKYENPDDFELGWSIFHRGGVLSVNESNNHRIEAIVRDDKLYEVSFDSDRLISSSCSCDLPHACAHRAALVFALYAPHGRPELLIQELKLLAAKKPARNDKSRPNSSRHQSTAPEEHRPPAEWQLFFDTRFRGFAISHSYTFDMFAEAVWESLLPYAVNWRPAIKLVYQLNIILFALRKIEDFYAESKTSYLSSYHETSCKTAVTQYEEKLLQLMKEAANLPIPSSDEPAWQETLHMLGQAALQGKNSPVDWLFVYRAVWSGLADHGDWIQSEIKLLDRHIQQSAKASASHQQDAFLIARAHFEIIQGRMDAAFALLNGLHKRTMHYFASYLKQHAEQGEWTLLLRWLRWLRPVMKTAVQEDFRLFCQYWTEAAKHTDSDAEWVEAMESLLPRSYYFYTAYLLQSGRYRKWIDLQLANRVSPIDLYALELRTVEEAEPKLLLPLYHQAIERAILEKNRASYKTAMKLLEKLATHYRTLGMTLEWTLFLQQLSAKFSRLRAFQDELKKGHWLS